MAKGILCGRNRVGRLMKVADLKPKQVKKFKATTNSKHSLPVAEDILNRDFTTTAPNAKWATNITYIWTREGWLYGGCHRPVFPVYRGLGDERTDNARTGHGCVEDGDMAPETRQRVIASFRLGMQYASNDYQALLAQYGLVCSMSRKGDCWDNAVTESFFHTLKMELVYHRDYETRR